MGNKKGPPGGDPCESGDDTVDEPPCPLAGLIDFSDEGRQLAVMHREATVEILPVGTEWDNTVGLLEFSNASLSSKKILVHSRKSVSFALGVFVNSHVIRFSRNTKRNSLGSLNIYTPVYPRLPLFYLFILFLSSLSN